MQATLKSDRLILRPFDFDDAKRVQLLAGDKRIADMTANIPHPYEDGVAEQWISSHRPSYMVDGSMAYAIVEQADNVLIGAISLIYRSPEEAELGYWLGVDYWGCGYATEAAKTLLAFADEQLALTKITARHLAHNNGSKKVILKCGFQFIEDRVDAVGGIEKAIKYYERISSATASAGT